jgi:hypothetical protein
MENQIIVIELAAGDEIFELLGGIGAHLLVVDLDEQTCHAAVPVSLGGCGSVVLAVGL